MAVVEVNKKFGLKLLNIQTIKYWICYEYDGHTEKEA